MSERTPCVLQCNIYCFFFNNLFLSTAFSIYPEMSSLVPIRQLRYLWSANVHIKSLMCHTNPLCCHPAFFSNIHFNIILPSSCRCRKPSPLSYFCSRRLRRLLLLRLGLLFVYIFICNMLFSLFQVSFFRTPFLSFRLGRFSSR